MPAIDLNCDLGEGFGHDPEMMALVTSANIGCGGHAGDRASMGIAVELARRHGVAIGAHPGFADREHFGRRDLPLSPAAIRELVRGQVEALRAIAPVRHVKPHGALYHRAERDPAAAAAIAEAVRAADPGLVLVGLAGGGLVRAGRACGLAVAGEAFVDRAYAADGSLRPRGEPGALITDPAVAATQAVHLAQTRADTLCLHGDGANPAALARAVRAALAAAGIALRTFGPGSA